MDNATYRNGKSGVLILYIVHVRCCVGYRILKKHTSKGCYKIIINKWGNERSYVHNMNIILKNNKI